MRFKYRQKTFDIEGVSQEDHIYRDIVNKRCFYEIDLLEYMYSIKDHLYKENAIAIDVGANIGNHSIFLQSFLVEHLIAVEPNPRVLPVLERNLDQNINNYSIYDCALGETDGMGMIVLPDGATNNPGMARVDLDGNDKSIRIDTLDSVVENWRETHNIDGNIAIIKIDVEGMELAVLKGARNTILKNRPHLFVEAATNEALGQLNDYLGSLGYRKISRWAGTPVYHLSYKPPRLLIIIARIAKFRRLVIRAKARLARKMKRLTIRST